jgi:predicted RNase H-like nuclease (RuvC/YqgF family)
MTKPLIVGIDIGVTTGLAIYDFDKNLLYSGSKRYISIDSLIREISFFGKPLIIATDKRKIPQPISKIAASFNCKVFNPDHDLKLEEKDEIIKIHIKDVHEKDALAAAMFAYKSYAGQFANIERTLDSLSLRKYSDRVKEMVISREAKNIADAIEKIKPKEEVKQIVKETFLNWREKAKQNEKKLNEEKNRYEILEVYAEKLEEKMKSLERQKQEYIEEEMKKNEEARKRVLKEKEIRKKDILIRQLQFELVKQKSFKESYEEEFEKQQELEEIEHERLIPIIILSEFTKENLIEINRKFDIKDKVLWIRKYKPSKLISRILISIKPKIVIADLEDSEKHKLKNSGIIVVDSLEPKIRRFYATISSEEIENAIKRVEKKDFIKWLEEYRKR